MNQINKISYNGELIDENSTYLRDNRAFRYGDSLFETIRVINGSVYNLSAHIDRLFQGAKTLDLELPTYFSEAFFKTEISKVIGVNRINGGGKVRLHLFRNGGGTYLSNQDDPVFLITTTPLESNLFRINQEGLLLDVYSKIRKEQNILANLKTGNSLLYVLAMNFAKKNNLNGAFILNRTGNIIETANSNIFLVSNGVLYTPPLSDGCVGGTMRMNLINIAIKHNIRVYESSITPQNLLVADEIILTNAVNGISWVGGYKTKRYFNDTAKKLLALINSKEASLKLDLKSAN